MSACADRERARLRSVAIGWLASRKVWNCEDSYERRCCELVADVFGGNVAEIGSEIAKVRRIMDTLRQPVGKKRT
jgi:hypothetical protein